jgi:hypothetical protein
VNGAPNAEPIKSVASVKPVNIAMTDILYPKMEFYQHYSPAAPLSRADILIHPEKLLGSYFS